MVNLYLDENVNIPWPPKAVFSSRRRLLAPILRGRNIPTTTALESKMLGVSDAEQLEFASSLDAALVTHNRVDFENLFCEYIQSGKKTAGIIILIRRDVYTMAQRLSRFCLQHKNIENQLFYV